MFALCHELGAKSKKSMVRNVYNKLLANVSFLLLLYVMCPLTRLIRACNQSASNYKWTLISL